jgi:SAM-dependent methyltransferase
MNAGELRRLAEVEDGLWHFRALHGHVRRALARRNLAPGAVVADAGCGTGGLLRRLAREFPRARFVGLDASPLAVAIARERCGCPVEAGSATALPWGGESLDAVTSIDVACQLERPVEAWREAARCLAPGGVLVVNVPAYRWLWSYHDVRVESRHRFTRSEVAGLLREAGLELVVATYWNGLALPLVAARRKLLAPPREGSDVRAYPAWVTLPMRLLSAVEGAWFAAGGRLPFGTSVFAVGAKPGRARPANAAAALAS